MQITRRHLLAYAAVISAPGTLVDIAIAQVGPVRTRESITLFAQDANKVAALRAAVAKMKARSVADENDPFGWYYWSAVHGTDKTVPVDLKDVYGQCDHTRRPQFSPTPSYIADHFFSWHRAYLFFFEAALKKAAQESGIAIPLELPYWNWYASGTMPAIFTTGDQASNPLWHDRVNTSVNAAALDRSFFAKKNLLPASRPAWAESFSVPLEFNPHGAVHSVIGKEMGRILTSARDPIFWLHHANIDRLWTSWLNMGDGRKNPAPGSTWAQKGFVFDKAGQLKQVAGAITNSETGLGYRYDDYTPFPGAVPAGPAAVMSQAPVIQMQGSATQAGGGTVAHSLGTTPNTTTVSRATSLTLGNESVALDMNVAPAIQGQLHSFAAGVAPGEVKSAWLVLENVEIGPDGRDGGFSFSVKATLPGGGPAVTVAELNTFNWPVPDPAPGGAHDHGAPQTVTLTIPLKDVLQELKVDSASALAGGLRVVFESVHPTRAGNPQFVKIGSVSIKTSNLAVQ